MGTIYRRENHKHKSLSLNRYMRHKDTILPQIKAALTYMPNNKHATASEQIESTQATIKRVIEDHERTPNPRRKPWCTTKHKQQIKKQHVLHKIRINNPTPENIRKHSKYRNKIRKIIKHAKREKLQQQLQDAKHNPKEQAKILKTLIPSRSSARKSPTEITYENKTYTDPIDIANAMNDHYITIGRKTNESIQRPEECIEDPC